MKHLAILSSLLLLASAARADRIADLADGRVRPSAAGDTAEAYVPIKLPSSHAANLLALPNGDLLCTWFSGTWENESDLGIVVSRLAKGSRQWTMPQVVTHKPGWAFQNPVLFFPPAGPLWLMHTSQKAGAGQAEARMYLLTSADMGATWSAPKLMFDQPGAFDRQRLIVTGDTWLLPMYFTPSFGITKDAEANYSVMKISRDKGKTWQECRVPKSDGLVQPDVIQLAPDRFVAFFRSRFADWVYKSVSPDGCAWSAPEATVIPNNNASIQVERLRNGHLVMAFNNTQAAPTKGKPGRAARVPVSIALSVDEGKTWPWVRDVETGAEVSKEPVPETLAGVHLNAKQLKSFQDHTEAYEYPSILQTEDGAIHVAYTFRRRTIKYVRIGEDWIKKGGTAGVYKGASH